MFRLAVKAVRHNPKRLILTAIAVALGVALISATHIFTDSLDRGFTRLFGEIYQGVDVIVEPSTPDGEAAGGGPAGEDTGAALDESVLATVQAVDGVAVAVGNTQATGALLDVNGEPIGGAQGFGPPTLFFNWAGDEALDSATVIDGRAPESDGELVLDVTAVEKNSLVIGDPIQVAGVTGVYDFTLVGSVRFGESNSTQGATLGWTTLDSVHQIAGEDTGFTSISVVVDQGADKDKVAEAIGAELPPAARAITGEAKAKEQAEALGDALQTVDIFTLAFAFVAVFVGAYIIANTFRIIVTQRTRELGLLRAVGVTGRQVRTMVLMEALVIGLVASVVGIGAGYALAGGIIGLLKALGPGSSFATPIIPLDAVIWGLAVGLLVTVGSALLPAIHASRITPMEALRDAATQTRKGLRTRNVVGGALAVAGVATITIGLYAGLEKPYIYVGVGAVLLILGVTLLAAQLLVPLAFALRGVLTRIWRVDGKLAANNIHREPRRSANTAAALMIGVMLLSLTATITQTVKAVAKDAVAGQITADFSVSSTTTPGPDDPAVVADLESVAGVDTVSRVGTAVGRIDGQAVDVTVLDTATAELMFAYETDPAIGNIDGGVFASQSVIDSGVAMGDTVTISGDAGSIDLEVTGVYQSEGDGQYFVDFAQAQEFASTIQVMQYLVKAQDGADLDQVRADLEDKLAADYPLFSVQSPDDLIALVNQIIDLMLAVITALLSGALIIAILGVANTLLLSVTERTREIGLLRAVGARRRSVRRIIRIEAVVMSVFGAVLGIILGVGLGVALVIALREFGFDTIAIPWTMLAVYTLLAILAGIVAAWWPARRASRLDILQAIAADG